MILIELAVQEEAFHNGSEVVLEERIVSFAPQLIQSIVSLPKGGVEIVMHNSMFYQMTKEAVEKLEQPVQEIYEEAMISYGKLFQSELKPRYNTQGGPY